MGDVINLNQYRKQRARDEKARQAKVNRAKSGRSGADKASQRQETDKAAGDHEGKQLGPGGKENPRSKPRGDREPPEDSTPSAR